MFAFSQVDDRTQGQVANLDIGLDQYLSNAWESGQQNSMFASVYHYNELGIEKDGSSMFGLLKWDTGKKLDPNEATQKYGLPGLAFTEPINEGAARMMHDRHMAETYRDVIASQGSGSLFSGRTLMSMGTQMIASTLNPLDLGTMFIPWTGSEKAMAAAGKMGMGSVRQGLARGLITQESLSALPTPKLIESLIHGVGFQALYEIPNVMSKFQNNEEHPFESIPGDLFTQAGFAGALHGVSRLMGLLSPSTHEYMLHKAVDDLVKGDNVKVDGVAKMEPAAEIQQLQELKQLTFPSVGEKLDIGGGFSLVREESNLVGATTDNYYKFHYEDSSGKQIGDLSVVRRGDKLVVSNHNIIEGFTGKRIGGSAISELANRLGEIWSSKPDELTQQADKMWQNINAIKQGDQYVKYGEVSNSTSFDPQKLQTFREQAVKDFANQSRTKKIDITPTNNHPESPSVDLRDNGNGPKMEEINQQIADLRQELGDHAEEVQKPEKPAKDPHQTAIDCILGVKS